MALQTTVFRDGAWVTETVSLQSIIKAHAPSNQTRPTVAAAPRCGLLTKTAIESSKVNQILPVKLRSPLHNDVAFIGEHFVQVYQLRRDGRLKEIIRKTDFGCRIRNACVVGPPDIKSFDEVQVDALAPIIKPDPDLPFPAIQSRLPPQLLMVALENGDVVFLFVRSGSDGRLEFVVERFQNPRASPKLGFRAAIDPSFHYMVLTCPEDYFVVYELESRQQLEQRYARGEPLRPVRFSRSRSVQGVIQNVAFLYPRAADKHHIILLLIIVNNEKSKMVIYEWTTGEDLTGVLSESKRGHRIPHENRMPLLLVPLTVRSAFIAVSADQISVCTECLHGPPNFETIDLELEPPTSHHNGSGMPLWTSWTRPSRLESFFERRDSFFLAREDGVVIYIEADDESLINRSTLVQRFEASISACASIGDQHADVLILGGDSGPGSVWRAPARKEIKQIGVLPNWSPVVDFTTTYHGCEKEKPNKTKGTGQLQKPDRIFATCENGKEGSITEYRYGKKASIGLTIEALPGMSDTWIFPSRGLVSAHSYCVLLSEPAGSAILSLSHDLNAIEPLDPESVPYDLDGPTLAFTDSDRLTVQVTTGSVVLASGSRSARYVHSSFECFTGAIVLDAYVVDECVAISAHIESVFSIFIFKIDQPRLELSHVRTIKARGEVTCLSITTDFTLLTGIWDGSEPLIGRCSLGQQGPNEIATQPLQELLADQNRATNLSTHSDIESIGSIVSTQGMIFLGTRSGELISLVEDDSAFRLVGYEKFGTTPVTLTCSCLKDRATPILLLTCDNNLVSINTDLNYELTAKSRVWPIDYDNPGAPPLPVHHARAVDIRSEAGEPQILIISGATLVLTELESVSGPVQRSIRLNATPTKIMYSHFLQCLVVAVHKDNIPSLLFVDPNTGEDLSKPVDSNQEPVEFISGLGKPGDRILCLNEWRFMKEGKTFYYLIVGTRNGHIVVISSQKEPSREASIPTRIRYSMRWKKDLLRPIYSVLGFAEGFVYCCGQKLSWELVEESSKRLFTLKSFELESPATSLKISNNKLLAMTNRDSLVVLDHIREDDRQETTFYNTDPRRHRGGDFVEITSPEICKGGKGSLVLVSDIECQIESFWIPWQTLDAEFEAVLSASLCASVRKFQVARTRPAWEGNHRIPRFGKLRSSEDGAELLGISLNGSMYHFTLLSIDTWRFLRFLQNLALANEELSPPSQHRDVIARDPEPRLDKGSEMQVDGDLLERVLAKGELARLVSKPQFLLRFMELLEEIDDGRHTTGFSVENDGERYLKLGYDILDYFLRPVI
ncbi:mono-functional DNA-alkylating methyl methanesulfonate N-term-domain-containing protein [Cladorrhinum sp. PSN259]|nr:mono-functional DNA-alkylating methyl methanesulfonate N-term-domain-containing protein [Cladorrhinum sp. PSN259]